MNPVARLARRLGHQPWFATVNRRILPPVDRVLHRVSGGRVRLSDLVSSTVILVHAGARSGHTYRTPLFYVPHADGWALAASNWGGRNHPAWSSNLIANPEAVLEFGRTTVAVRARPAGAEERDEIWDRLRSIWPAYDAYRERADRDIRLFVLERR